MGDISIIKEGDVGSLGLLSFSLCLFLQLNGCNNILYGCVFTIFGGVSFFIAIYLIFKKKENKRESMRVNHDGDISIKPFIKAVGRNIFSFHTQNALPLIFCKKRYEESPAWVCNRHIGFFLGWVVSIFVLLSIKFSWITVLEALFSLDKNVSFFIGVLCVFITIIHGTYRRKYHKLLAPEGWWELVEGFVAGLGLLFFCLFFI